MFSGIYNMIKNESDYLRITKINKSIKKKRYDLIIIFFVNFELGGFLR